MLRYRLGGKDIAQVLAIGAALARILGLWRGGAVDYARVGLDSAYGLLLGTRSDLLRTLDVATAAALVDAPDAILALARLSAEEVEQDGDADRRAGLRLRSVAPRRRGATGSEGEGGAGRMTARRGHGEPPTCARRTKRLVRGFGAGRGGVHHEQALVSVARRTRRAQRREKPSLTKRC